MRRAAPAASLFAGLCWAGAAAAATPAETLAAFGLLGTWSPDCSAMPSADNPRVVWMGFGTRVLHQVSLDGGEAALSDVVVDAAPVPPDRLRLTFRRATGPMLTAVVQMVEGRVHTVESASASGQVFYRGGIEVATGKPAVSDERCGFPVS